MKANLPNRSRLTAFRTYVLAMILGLIPLSSAGIANAQGQGSQSPSTSSLPRVTAVNGRIEVGQIITVDVDHLSDWSAIHDPRKLVPYLNGRALKGLYPEQVDLSENRLLFHLKRTAESKGEWANLFHEPVLRRPVSFSVGLEDQSPFNSIFDGDNQLAFTVIPKTWGLVSLAVVLGLLILFIYLTTRTNILRDPGPTSAPGTYGPYDLGRVQTAFWFFIVSTSYLCIWLITGDLDTLTPSVLGLLGITAVTSLVPHLTGTPRNDIDQPIGSPETSTNGALSKGFFADIISDTNGYSFHRFQMLLWTFLLGVIFMVSVYDNLAMPKFSGSLLALMGVSAGTYLGFELLSKRSASDDLGVGKEVFRLKS